MVFVYKDLAKPVTHINTVPIEQLEFIKTWLTDVDIPYTVSTINLNWSTIMKSLQDDPHQFFLDGGWSFLATGSDDEGSDASEEEISEYEASEEDPSDEEVYSEEEYSEEEKFSDEGSEDFDDASEEDGDDWDELEKKAANADRENRYAD